MKKLILIVLLLAAAGGAWFFHFKDAAAPGARNPLLAGIPADTLWFIGSVEAMPADAGMAKMYQATFGLPANLVEEIVKDTRGQGAAGERFLREWSAGSFAMFEDLPGHLAKFGLAEKSHFALFAVAGTPVFRLQVADEAAFRQQLKAAEARAELQGSVDKLGDIEYTRYAMADPEQELIWSLHDGVWTLSLQSQASKAQVLARVLGAEAPQISLQDTDTLQQIITTHQLLPMFIGYLNHQEIAKLVTDPQDHRVQNIRAILGAAAVDPEPSTEWHDPACRKELGEIAALWPRTVFGLTTWDTAALSFESKLVLESKAGDFLQDLRSLRGHIPRYLTDPDSNPLYAVAFGLRTKQLAGFLQRTAQRLMATSYTCAALARRQRRLAKRNPLQAQMALNLVPALDGFGIALFALDIDWEAAGTGPQMLRKMTAIATLSAEDPAAVLTSAQTWLPDIQAFLPPADGSVVEVPMPPDFGFTDQRAKAGVMGKHLALFTAGDAEPIAAALKNEGLDANGLIYFKVDYGWYFDVVMQGVNFARKVTGTEPEAEEPVLTWLRSRHLRATGWVDVNTEGLVYQVDLTAYTPPAAPTAKQGAKPATAP